MVNRRVSQFIWPRIFFLDIILLFFNSYDVAKM
jgi:hypothetical protein